MNEGLTGLVQHGGEKLIT